MTFNLSELLKDSAYKLTQWVRHENICNVRWVSGSL